MIRIRPKNYINESYVEDYYYYSKAKAIQMYLSKNPKLTKKDLIIE